MISSAIFLSVSVIPSPASIRWMTTSHPPYGLDCPPVGVKIDAFAYTAFFSYSGSIDKGDFPPWKVHSSSTASRVVPGMSDTIERSYPMKALRSVRFPGIRASHDRYFKAFFPGMEPFLRGVGQLSCPAEADVEPVEGGNGQNVVESHLVEVSEVLKITRAVHLVDGNDNRKTEPADYAGQFNVK